ncbi:MAG: membrane protein insertase YidC [Candidatus Taylorbacteria bacterium]|nr:membrane protein insertase YidC [Candidatus Taylorbacteria bacterium]
MFSTLFYNPLYNALVFLIDVIPGGDVGIATIVLTCIVKLVLFPLSKQATKTQLLMKKLEPEMKKLREKYEGNREQLALKTLEFYKENNLNPFASFFLILIQLPIILALAFVFLRGGLPVINTEILYSFINVPYVVNTNFLGLVDITKVSLILGVLTGLAQFVQIRLSVPALEKKDVNASKNPSFGEDFQRSMNVQMRYVMPIFMFIVCLNVSGAVALYWITGSIFMIAQELYIRKTVKSKFEVK